MNRDKIKWTVLNGRELNVGYVDIERRPYSAEYLAYRNEQDLSDGLDQLHAVLTPMVLGGECPAELRWHGYQLRQDVRRSEEFGGRSIAGQMQLTGADTTMRLSFDYYSRHDGSTLAWAEFGIPSPSGTWYRVALRRDATGLWTPDFPAAMTDDFYRASLEFLEEIASIETNGHSGLHPAH